MRDECNFLVYLFIAASNVTAITWPSQGNMNYAMYSIEVLH